MRLCTVANHDTVFGDQFFYCLFLPNKHRLYWLKYFSAFVSVNKHRGISFIIIFVSSNLCILIAVKNRNITQPLNPFKCTLCTRRSRWHFTHKCFHIWVNSAWAKVRCSILKINLHSSGMVAVGFVFKPCPNHFWMVLALHIIHVILPESRRWNTSANKIHTDQILRMFSQVMNQSRNLARCTRKQDHLFCL